ncbi:hypothetical protein C6503_00990 [Candidatus Poribacteria bacterium]|nr:MAG: hypothetical protein C6503_00990 [Candidatus Poribacteria bacterium]
MKNSDFALIRRTLDGDQNAFTTLVNKYQKWVHTLVWRKTGDFHIAEEITQDVFLKVYKKLATLKPSDHFTGWLYVIASRRCIAWIRKKQLPTTSLDAMPISELEEFCYTQYETELGEKISLERQRATVKRLLQKLPESERTVVTLHYLAEMSCEKISEFLGVSPNTIKSRLHRARARLKEQERLLHDASGIFQVPSTLTENITREIAQIKPDAPSAAKPWVPWGFSLAATFLIILMIGQGTHPLSRFQQPYDLEATSKMTVELIDTSIVRELKRESAALTRFGRADTPDQNSGPAFQTESPLTTTAQADGTDISTAKPEWMQTKGPGTVSKPGLFLTTDRTLYAIAKTGLYRLTEKADAWTFVSASGPNRELDPVMAEYDDTLYLLTSDELLASTDGGETLDTLSARPRGRAVALIITDDIQEHDAESKDMTMYLVLRTAVFRSEDAGKAWTPIGEVLQTDSAPDVGSPGFRIWDALAVDNTLFVGTSRGLFRLTEGWEKLSVPTSQGINSLAVAENKLYVGTNTDPQDVSNPYFTPAIFYSADFGSSWTDITPRSPEFLTTIITTLQVVPVGKMLMVIGPSGMLLSYDGGKTWMDPGNDFHTFGIGVSPVVVLDKSNLYKSDDSGVVRSVDGGTTWHSFTTGLVNSGVPNLVTVENVLYALTPTQMLKSADGGEWWEPIGLSTDGSVPLQGAKIATVDDVLYASSSKSNGVTLSRLSDAGDAFLPIEGVPDFEVDPWHTPWSKKGRETWANSGNIMIAREQERSNQHHLAEKYRSNGTFALTNDTVFMEYKRKLFRWRRGETAWHDTGLEDSGYLSYLIVKPANNLTYSEIYGIV